MLVLLVFLSVVLIFAVLSNIQRGHWDLKHKPSVATEIPMLPLCHSPELALIAHEAIEHQADVRLKLCLRFCGERCFSIHVGRQL